MAADSSKMLHMHWVKSVQMRHFFWSVFSCIQTEYGEKRSISPYSPNAGKYGAEKTPYLDTFYSYGMKNFVTIPTRLSHSNLPGTVNYV